LIKTPKEVDDKKSQQGEEGLLLTVQELKNRVTLDLPSLVEQLTLLTGRDGANEKKIARDR